jgi:hypothetical protein
MLSPTKEIWAPNIIIETILFVFSHDIRQTDNNIFDFNFNVKNKSFDFILKYEVF